MPSETGYTKTELAGNSLTQYPYFEYVKAFNENAEIKVAIDPRRFPAIVGKTADIYVVESKDESGWQSDPSLNDATPGGALEATFGGNTIQENTFTIASEYDLSSAVWVEATNAFTGLGRGYDVVIDLNRNGILDDGDFIDGFGNEAGLYVVHDVTQPGPLEVTESEPYSVGTIFDIPADETQEIVYYPTDIASMQPLPLIVISHGSGHEFTWYDHIAYHMASYGYVVMAHENIPTATTQNHTDAILELQSSIAGGILNGKIDSDRIIWIGHSHGAVNVARGYHKIYVGEYVPTNYSIESIVLISSMLPPGGTAEAGDLPHDSNFHMWTASGDNLVSGAAHFDLLQTFQLYERAEGWRMSTIVQGTGHAWFHNGEEEFGPWFEGPDSIGKEGTHIVQKGLFLPLIKHFAEGNIPATDFFYRQFESFHPIGIDNVNLPFVVTNECRENPAGHVFFIDDYQSEFGENVGSSGGAVSFNVENLTEGRLDDNNDDFAWASSDPFNGATQDGPADDSRGVVFEWNDADRYYEWEIVPSARDFSGYKYISFRGAQGTRHPNTLFYLGDETFALTLRDADGVSSSINIGAYGGGLEQPYQRNGGWHNEMERVRIRLIDFLTNGTGIDLSNISAVRLDLGPSWGASKGRIVIDELMLSGTNDETVPVELSSFYSRTENGFVTLFWLSATETNNKGFEVRRSVSSEQSTAWKTLGFVEGAGTTSEPRNYSFTDKNISRGKIYRYRLKQIDLDGSFRYSKIIEVELNAPGGYLLSQNYPNPYCKTSGENSGVKINFTLPKTGEVKIEIFNLLGEKVKTLVNKKMEAGFHTVKFTPDAFPSGIYLYRMTAGSFLQTKKMAILK